jgi:hypothetical protein
MKSRARQQTAAKPRSGRTAVMYVRVSSKEQEQGFSIPAQRQLLTEYADREGIHVVQEFEDVETAKRAGRTSFGEMVDFLRNNQATCRTLLVEKTDRLYRNIKDWVTIDELGIEVHSSRKLSSSRKTLVDLEIRGAPTGTSGGSRAKRGHRPCGTVSDSQKTTWLAVSFSRCCSIALDVPFGHPFNRRFRVLSRHHLLVFPGVLGRPGAEVSLRECSARTRF